MVSINDVISRLDKPKRISTAKGMRESYQTICPCHQDKKQSLSVSLSNDGKILLHCHAGCRTEDIISSIGYTMSDLCTDNEKPKCFDRIAKHYEKEFGSGVRITAEYPYYNEDGIYQYSKVRLEGGTIKGKEIRYYVIDKIKDTYSRPGEKRGNYLYRLPEFLKLKDKAKNVYIVEGEKDVETLRKLGQGFGCCVTAGSVSNWQSEYARYFKGLDVIIIRDNDNAGLKLAEEIKSDLSTYAYCVRIVNPSSLDHGDVTDYLTKEDGTAESLKRLCDQAQKHYAVWMNIKDNSSSVNSGILAEVIANNEQYIILRNVADEKDALLFWDKGVYKQVNKSGIKAIIKDYIPSSKQTTTKLNDVADLLLATNENVHAISEIDNDEQYINFKNGLLDIRTKTLIPHDTDILSTVQYPFDYDPSNNHHPWFDKYIRDLCSKYDGRVDEEEIKQIQEYCGFLISNISMFRIKKALVLWSREGDSGKSALLRLISCMIQMRETSIKLTELTPANRFILGSLPYCRLISCGDESNATVKDSSIFKACTGGDALKIESKGRQAFTYTYRGGFVICCNGLPFFSDDHGNHLFKRLLILPCENSIDDDKKDTTIEDKMQKEIPAIMNWCLEGLYRLIENRYTFSSSGSNKRIMEEYRCQMDNVYRFIKENYIITHEYQDRIRKTDFDDAYTRWAAQECPGRIVERKNLAARLESYGIKKDNGNVGDSHNQYVYRGIKIKPIENIDFCEDEQDDNPFNS